MPGAADAWSLGMLRGLVLWCSFKNYNLLAQHNMEALRAEFAARGLQPEEQSSQAELQEPGSVTSTQEQ